MKTNYNNMSVFDAAATCMIVVGIALIGLQFYLAASEETQKDIVTSLVILDLNETWQVQKEVISFVFGGMNEFYEEFTIAANEVLNTEKLAEEFSYIKIAWNHSYDQAKMAYEFIAHEYAPYLASSYTNNFAPVGVEPSMGGKVLGEYFEKFGE